MKAFQAAKKHGPVFLLQNVTPDLKLPSDVSATLVTAVFVTQCHVGSMLVHNSQTIAVIDNWLCSRDQRRVQMKFLAAPELQTTDWLNADEPVLLGALRGKVVLIEAFQMLCPGCVSHGLPQAMRVHRVFDRDEVAVIGLHTVFEHHGAQGSRVALAAFLHEYKIAFPVGIDAPSDIGGLPKTMARYGMKGTPTLLLVDQRGRLRKHKFGWEDDLVLGAEIMSLIRDGGDVSAAGDAREESTGCTDEGCSPAVA